LHSSFFPNLQFASRTSNVLINFKAEATFRQFYIK
jgi:hypothetical protein